MNAGLDRIISFLARRPIDGRRNVIKGLGVAGALALGSCRIFEEPSCREFNGGRLRREGSGSTATFYFSTTSMFQIGNPRDPGVAIMAAEFDLEGENISHVQTITFEIRGTITGDPNARLVAQVYSARDNESVPSLEVELHPTGAYRPVTVRLDGRIDILQKLQFVLATETGDCNVEIRNVRFN